MMTIIPGTRKEQSQHYEWPTSCYPTREAAWRQANHALNEMRELYSGILDDEIHEENFGRSGVIWAQLVRKDPPGMLHCSGMISGM